MIKEKVLAALESIRSVLMADGGDVELVSVDDKGVVSVRLTGACGGCPMAQMTLRRVIETRLKEEVPEVTAVVGA
ncbi:MAG: NifU family protein [Treponematales bacterium]